MRRVTSPDHRYDELPGLPRPRSAALRRPIKLFAALAALTVAAAACGDSAAGTSPAPSTSTTAPPPTLPPNTTAVTLPPPPETTTVDTRPNPLTNTEVTQDQLMLMTLDDADFSGLLAGISLDQRLVEGNDEAIRKAFLDPGDESADVERFEREAGARAIFLPRGTPDKGVDAVHVWVSLFADEAGASGYLDDWFLDTTKSVGGGHPAPLRITSVTEFIVRDLGAESLGVVLEETVPGDPEPELFETVVVFRVGRLLVFTSMVSAADSDLRVPAIQLADRVEERTLAVLRGNVRPAPPPPPPTDLAAYAFEFRQSVFRPRTRVDATATGVVVLPDRVQCEVNVAVDGFDEIKRYVAIGDRAWYDLPEDVVPGLTEAPRDTDFIAADLLFCPGWTVLAEDSGLNFAVADAPWELVEVGDRTARSYRLGAGELKAMGYIPFDSEISVDRFDVRLDTEEPWVLGLDIDLSGVAPQFSEAFGDEFAAGESDRVRMELRMTVTRINDPTLAVVAPG